MSADLVTVDMRTGEILARPSVNGHDAAGGMSAVTLRLAGAERELAALTTAEEARELADKAAAVAELAKRAKLGTSARARRDRPPSSLTIQRSG